MRSPVLLLAPLLLASACKEPLIVESYLAVVNISPSHGAANVSVEVEPLITFTEGLMGSGVNSETFSLLDPTGAAVAISVLPLDDYTVHIAPETPLDEASAYTIWVSGDLEGERSGAMGVDIETTFTTEGFNPGGNALPVAVLEPSYTAAVGEVVAFDGSQSYDPEAVELTYQWKQVAAPADSGAHLNGMFGDAADLTPDTPGVYVISLTVSDGEQQGNTAWAQVVVDN